MIALFVTSCASSRKVSEASTATSHETLEMRDSVREEIAQNLEENLTEHEVITETVFCNDSVKVERVTDRVTVRERSARTEAKKEEVRVVRDTVYIEHRDSVMVQETAGGVSNDGTARASPWVSALKWIFWIIVGLSALIIIVKLKV